MDGGGVITGDEPVESILPLCHVSSSQEERLRRCPFAPERDNPENDESSSESNGEIPVASTGIMMMSLPESEGETTTASPATCSTPRPRSRRRTSKAETLVGGVLTAKVKRWPSQLGARTPSRDSDVGFLEVQLTQRENADFDLDRSPAEVLERGSMGARVLTGELSLEDRLGELPLKKLKVSEQSLEESDEELEPERATLPNHSSDSDEILEIDGGDGKSGEKSLAKRKLEFSDNDNLIEVVELGSEPNDGVSNPSNAKGNGTFEVNEQQSNGKEKASSQEFVGTGATQEIAAVEHEQLLPPARRRLPNSLLGRSESVVDGHKGCHRLS